VEGACAATGSSAYLTWALLASWGGSPKRSIGREGVKLKVSQRPEAFFDLFEESGANLVAATDQLRDMLHD
jgi:hypothetical protein